MKGSILITGAAGFIGSHTVDFFIDQGWHVIAADNLRTGRQENLERHPSSSGLTFAKLDVTDRESFKDLLVSCKPRVILHLAALVSVQESMEKPGLNFQLNLESSHIVVDLARELGIRRVVFASSAAVYGDSAPMPASEDLPGDPITPYGGAKLASEHLLLSCARTYGLSVICQRYFNVYGPRQDPGSPYSGVISIFQRRFSRGEQAMIFGDGHQTRDFISVYDVARANYLAATAPWSVSGRFNICTGRSTSLIELASLFQAQFPDSPAPAHIEARPGDIRNSLGDPGLAHQTLGFKAAIPIEEGLRHWLRQNCDPQHRD